MAKIYAVYSINDVVVKDIFHLWEECKERTSGKKAVFKSFSNKSEVDIWFDYLDKLYSNPSNEAAASSASTVSIELPKELYIKIANAGIQLSPPLTFIKTLTKIIDDHIERHLSPESDVTYGSDVQASQELLGPQLFNQLKASSSSSLDEIPPWKI